MKQTYILTVYIPPGTKVEPGNVLSHRLSNALVNAGFTNSVEFIEEEEQDIEDAPKKRRRRQDPWNED